MPEDVPGEIDLFGCSDCEEDVAHQEPRQEMNTLKNNTPKWWKSSCDIEMPYTSSYLEKKMEMIADLDAKLRIEVFETLFDEDVVNLIVEQTFLYASQANLHNFVLPL